MAARKSAKGSNVVAVEAELKAMAAASSSLGVAALTLARVLDSPVTKPADVAACSRALRETLDRLRELSPPKREKDAVDEVTSRRNERRSRHSAA
jgi:purine-nucleoside phosphorylase